MGVQRYDAARDRPAEGDSIIHGKQARREEIDLFLAELDKLKTVTEFHEDVWF
ncbi:hypothetical protein ABXS75_05180 [Roseburia hominis]